MDRFLIAFHFNSFEAQAAITYALNNNYLNTDILGFKPK